MAAQETVRLTAKTGEWVDLGTLGPVEDLFWKNEYAGGPTEATCRLGVRAQTQHPALFTGADVQIFAGMQRSWRGRARKVDRTTDPWTLEFDGLAAVGGNTPAPRSGTLTQILTQAIADGLPWTIDPNAQGLDSTWDGADGGVGKTPLSDVLRDTLLRTSRRWTLSNEGVFSTQLDPTAPSLILDLPGVLPTSLSDYATIVSLRYTPLDEPVGTPIRRTVTRRDEAAVARYGPVVKKVDAGNLRLSSDSASALWAGFYADRYLARVAPRVTTVGELVVDPGQLMTAQGSVVDLASTQVVGQVAQVRAARMVSDSQVVGSEPVHVLIGSTRYDATTGLLTIGPDGRSDTPAQLMFGRYGGGDR